MTMTPDMASTVPAELAHLIKEVEPPKLDTFGDRLEYVRNLAGLSRVKMAETIDVPPATYTIWANGAMPNRPDPFEVCVRVEKAFGVPRAWLAWGSDTKQCSVWFSGYQRDQYEGYGDGRLN